MKTIYFSRPTIEKEEIKEVINTLKSGWLVSGPKVLEFEKRISNYLGAKFIRVLNSCTSCLELAILSFGFKNNSEIITTPFTFCATINAIIHNNLKPVFADIDKETFNILPNEILKKITKKTKAILLVHYGGLACDMDKILDIKRKYNLKIIEDAAHAFGAEYKGKKIGNFSDITCFSFHATKNLTTIEGGAIATNKKYIIDFINKAYFHGIDRDSYLRNFSWKYKVVYPGFKYNLADVSAALGIVQLKKLDIFIRKRTEIASIYNEVFLKNDYITLQKIPYSARHTYYLYPILIDIDRLKINRDQFIEELRKKRIITSLHFIPIYKHPAYKNLFSKEDIENLKNTEYVYNRIISLPIYPKLELKDVKYIANTINRIIYKYAR